METFKTSSKYQVELDKVARPYFEHGFAACKEQFMVNGYPSNGEEPSFLDLEAAMGNAPNFLLQLLQAVIFPPTEETLDRV
ncbi:UNVERIFIED_CONTAM: hypothetical protein Sradi_7148400 [Sesamum radiatum]|uniref:Uncharacterized protein n=1 Tax=Sesamum radiatum TaxID=300843 RepID=A0AAW2IW30_SESRA